MPGDVVSIGGEIAVSHFIDQDQAETLIEQCEAHLKEEAARGRPVAEAHRFLKLAREFLESGMFTKAFMFALQARGIAVERLPGNRRIGSKPMGSKS